MNIVMLTGNLGQDPENKTTNSGKSVCTINLAVRDDFDREKTDWVRVIFWEKKAELVAKHLKKGSKILVTGKLSVRDYTDKDGHKKTMTEVIANNLEFLDSKPKVDNTMAEEDLPF